MKQIRVVIWEDSYDCHSCGYSYATGGKVFVDGAEVLCLEPIASCYDSVSFSATDLLAMALVKLGIEVQVDDKKYELSSFDVE
jgi:hypothetical protein